MMPSDSDLLVSTSNGCWPTHRFVMTAGSLVSVQASPWDSCGVAGQLPSSRKVAGLPAGYWVATGSHTSRPLVRAQRGRWPACTEAAGPAYKLPGVGVAC